ncbi:hypothetical protein [Oculatella sp. LEGE 06141]|nr:hypothetical protein [Oculatella sp. LEGE 06141]
MALLHSFLTPYQQLATIPVLLNAQKIKLDEPTERPAGDEKVI